MNVVLLTMLASAAFAAPTEHGAAVIMGTSDGSAVGGTVVFSDTKDGLKVTVSLTGLPPGTHGFHIHEFGACGDAGKAAGGHYNPLASKHGDLMREGMKKAHAGDLGNITAGADGTAKLEAVLRKLSLGGGKYTVGGRAIVIHEKADDFGQPAGNAGGRIACGLITLAPPAGAPAK